MKEIKKDILLRAYLVYLGVLLIGLAILGKAIYIQSFEGKELLQKAKKQEMRLFDVDAIRGNICADDGTLLATSVPIFDVRMDVSSGLIGDDFFKKNVDSLAICLSGLFRDKRPSEYRDMLWEARRNGDRFLMIQRDITYPELKKMRKFPILRLGKYRGGMIVIPQYTRRLPYDNLARRTIGYESEEAPNKVFVGLEGYFAKNLQGIGGKRLKRRVGNGEWMPVDIEDQVEPQNGEDIITTLNVNIQDMVESALEKELIRDSADHGCVIVMEVKTGYIRAIANLGKTSSGRYEEVFNYAVGESTEPGSTFKLASFLVALEDGKIDLNTPVNTGNGTAVFSGRTMNDSHKGGYGIITAQEVFEKSSNVGTSKLIYGSYAGKPQQYIDGLYRMGIHRPLDLQIGGEGRPYIKTTRSKWWSNVSLPWMSVGYEVALTPLQLLTLYNAVANDGKMMKPILVREIRKNGSPVMTCEPRVINPSICSPATLQKVKILLEGVVQRGTGSLINNPVYRIAGKTGTAQLAMNNRGYKTGEGKPRYKGSFAGYFPADDPKYSIIVVIHDPRGGQYYGAQIAAPVFREIADRIYATMIDIDRSPGETAKGFSLPFAMAGTQKDLKEIYTLLEVPVRSMNPNAPYVRPLKDSLSVTLMPEPRANGAMPDVTGMGARDAVFLLEQAGLKVILKGKGMVVRQSIAPGNLFVRGTVVVLDLAPIKT
jgi:cell division protein FtsI (penicillin-binding protein 3)